MVQFIQYDPGPSLGQSLGSALGGGLQQMADQIIKGRSPESMLKRAQAEETQRKSDLMRAQQAYAESFLGKTPQQDEVSSNLRSSLEDAGAPQEETISEQMSTFAPQKEPTIEEKLKIEEEIHPEPYKESIESRLIRSKALGTTEAEKLKIQKEEITEKQYVKDEAKKRAKHEEGIAQLTSTMADLDAAFHVLETGINNQTPLDTIMSTVADKLNIPGLQGAKSAQISSAVKQFFITDLGKLGVAGTRANQFLERMLSGALANPRNTPFANKIVLESMRMTKDLSKERIRVSEEVEDYYRSRGRQTPGNVEKIVKKFAQDGYKKIMDSYDFKIQDLYDKGYSESDILLGKKITKGESPLSDTAMKIFIKEAGNDINKAFKAAKKAGYKI